MSETTEESRKLPRLRTIQGLRCEQCGSPEVAPLPPFSVGSGTASRTFAADVICKRCRHIALPILETKREAQK